MADPPTLDLLPAPPSRANPSNFAQLADGFLAALVVFGVQVNALVTWLAATASLAESSQTNASASAIAAGAKAILASQSATAADVSAASADARATAAGQSATAAAQSASDAATARDQTQSMLAQATAPLTVQQASTEAWFFNHG